MSGVSLRKNHEVVTGTYDIYSFSPNLPPLGRPSGSQHGRALGRDQLS